jgi:hypothetical protein
MKLNININNDLETSQFVYTYVDNEWLPMFAHICNSIHNQFSVSRSHNHGSTLFKNCIYTNHGQTSFLSLFAKLYNIITTYTALISY